MKAKALFAGTLSAIMLIGLTGCGVQKGEKAFFSLKSLPDAEVFYTADDTNYRRNSENFTEFLAPSESYGEIFPFAGEMIEYNGDGKNFKNSVFGFCTADGTVICDPSYDAVLTHEVGDSYIYELVVGSDGSDAGTRYLAASNGSWIFELKNGCSYAGLAGSERFAVKRPRTVRKGGKTVTYEYYDFYDLSGNLSFTFDRKMTEDETLTVSIGAFSEGLAPINVVKTDPKTGDSTPTAYYIDTKGDVYESDDYLYCGEFFNGYAVVENTDGKFGVLKSDGEYFIEPKYNVINYNNEDGFFSCGEDGLFTVFNMNGEQVTRVLCEKGNVTVFGKDVLIYKKTIQSTGKSEYYSVTADKPFMCAETGQFPSEDSGSYGLFYSSYSNVTDIFDENGKTLCSLTDFGRVSGKLDDTAVLTDKTSLKTAFLNINTGEKTDWLDGTFVGEYFGTKAILKGSDCYYLYDTASKDDMQTVDFAKSYSVNGKVYTCILTEGSSTLYDSDMNIILKFKTYGEATS